MASRLLLARITRTSILAATAATLVALAAACSSPTSPTANATASTLHNTNTPVAHNACDGVGAGSGQC
jgi:hypothetical protein